MSEEIDQYLIDELYLKYNNKIVELVQIMNDYVKFILSKEYNETVSSYMIGYYENKRRDLHDNAMYALNKLNELSLKEFGEKIYNIEINDDNRAKITKELIRYFGDALNEIEIRI